MRPLELVRLLVVVTLLAAAPVVGAVALYAETSASGDMRQAARPLDTKLPGPDPVAGQNVVTTDGERVGHVVAVTPSYPHPAERMYFSTGGFLGFGARTVAVPAGRFAVSGQNVYLNLTADEIGNLPVTSPRS